MIYLSKKDLILIHSVKNVGSTPHWRFHNSASAGVELYPTLTEKAAILGFATILNHPFREGNKRTGYLAME